MKTLGMFALAALLTGGSYSWAQQQSPDTGTQHSQDVPHQQPGTNNPDVSKQRQPTPGSKSDGQSQSDVPQQQPGTNNPDVSKQRKPTPKKSKQSKTTGSTTGAT